MINELIVCVALLGQSDAVYHDLIIDEPIRTKCYIMAKMPTGLYLEIPIVNGYIPDIVERRYCDGSLHRKMDYNKHNPYCGTTNFIFAKPIPAEPIAPPLKEVPKRPVAVAPPPAELPKHIGPVPKLVTPGPVDYQPSIPIPAGPLVPVNRPTGMEKYLQVPSMVQGAEDIVTQGFPRYGQ